MNISCEFVDKITKKVSKRLSSMVGRSTIIGRTKSIFKNNPKALILGGTMTMPAG